MGSKRAKDTEGGEEGKRRKRKHRDPEGSPDSKETKDKDKGRRRRHKEKRKHGDDSEDSDISPTKTGRYDEPHNSRTRRERSKSRSPSPDKPSGDGSSLSIQETNKLRAKLGLKPLEVEVKGHGQRPPAKKKEELEDGEHEEDFDEETLRRIREEREKEGETFWKEQKDFVHAPAENLTRKIQEEKLRNKINTMKEKRKLEQKVLEGKGLADEDDDDLDAAKWVTKQKTLAEQKAIAAKRAKELDDLDDEFGVGEVVETEFVKHKNKSYTHRDLKGMKVLHDQSRLQSGERVILTLQDKGVLDEDDDALVNVNLIDDERYDKNLENKKVRPEHFGYNAYDEIEYDNQGNLKTKSMLGKYDEEISGSSTHQKSFVIGQKISEEARQQQILQKMQRADKVLDSAESLGLRLASDFYTPDEMVAFKKPGKKKVRKVRKALRADDLLKLNTEINQPQEGVINQRDLGSRNRKKEVKVEGQGQVDMEIDLEIDDFAPRIEVDISDVKLEDEADIDFQRALHQSRKLKQKQLAKPRPKQNVGDIILQERNDLPAESGNAISIVLHSTAEFCRTLGDIPSIDTGDLYGDEEMDFEQEEKYNEILEEERGAWNEVGIDETPVDITRIPEQEDQPILEQEPDVGVGLAGALKLAQKKGYLEQEHVKRIGGATMRHLQAQHYTIEDKNYEEERVSKRDMYSGPTSDFREKDGYRPEVKLEYNDEDGKPISAKEAFRLLSHKFHGKGSGKNKIDKKRKKMEQEKLLQHMNSTDTPLGTLELLQQKMKKTHQAYLVLSGNKQQGLSKTNKR